MAKQGTAGIFFRFVMLYAFVCSILHWLYFSPEVSEVGLQGSVYFIVTISVFKG